jgi:hypothetical protein
MIFIGNEVDTLIRSHLTHTRDEISYLQVIRGD